jgi:hypothetical protein
MARKPGAILVATMTSRYGLQIASVLVFAAVALVGFAEAAGPRKRPVNSEAEAFDAYRHATPLTGWPLERIEREVPELTGLASGPETRLPDDLKAAANGLHSFWEHFPGANAMESLDATRVPHSSVSNRVGVILTMEGVFPIVDGRRFQDHFQRDFHYRVLVDSATARVSEFRLSLFDDNAAIPSGFLTTAGFASMVLFFSEQNQKLCDFRYLGSQTLDNRAFDLVAFAQHVDPAAVLSHWTLSGTSIPVLLQGVAWVDPSDGHILRMRTSLLAPQPLVHLKRVTTGVLFTPVKIERDLPSYWMPKDVEVIVDLDDFSFVNIHHFTGYALTGGEATAQR